MLETAMKEEALVQDSDLIDRLKQYYHLANSEIQAIGCRCCGWLDVPISDPKLNGDMFNINSFKKIYLTNNTNILNPLYYTPTEEQHYNLQVPPHIEDTEVNRDRWIRYRYCFVS